MTGRKQEAGGIEAFSMPARTIDQVCRKHASCIWGPPAALGCRRRIWSVRQGEDGQLAAKVGVLGEGCVATHCAEAGVRVGQTGSQADAGPAADEIGRAHV